MGVWMCGRRIPSHPRAEAVMYGEKHPRWWVQSFLAGVPLMVLGGRDDKGMLQKVSRGGRRH